MIELAKIAPAAALVAMIALAPAHAADGTAPSQKDLNAAAALNAQGDAAYRAGSFDKALKAYLNAYPNSPNARAYLMAGDAYWRAVLTAHARTISDGARQSCSTANTYFAEDVQRSLDQHYRRGLALASREQVADSGERTLVERSSKIATCLTTLQLKYAGLPKTACVDLRSVASCLGEPLNP